MHYSSQYILLGVMIFIVCMNKVFLAAPTHGSVVSPDYAAAVRRLSCRVLHGLV